MSDRRAVIAIVGSAVLLIAVVLVVVFVAIIPIPGFDELRPGAASGRIAFVATTDDCLVVADLQLGTVDELTCEYPFPEGLHWTRRGIELTVFSGAAAPVRVTLDPATGAELDVRSVETDEIPSRDPSLVRRRPDQGSTIIGPDGTTVLTLEGPERYAVEIVATSPDEMWVAFVDSLSRLAVLEIGTDAPLLVAEDVRSFPAPVWEP